MHTYSSKELDDLAAAHRLQAEINRLQAIVDSKIEPIVKAAVKSGDTQRMQDLIAKLPFGFHRTELQTAINHLDPVFLARKRSAEKIPG